MRRVTGGFDARKMCDRRRYEYVAPAFVFDPTACRERQWYYDEVNAQRHAAALATPASDAGGAGSLANGTEPTFGQPNPKAAAPSGLGVAAADDAAVPADGLLSDAAAVGGDPVGQPPVSPAADGAANGSHRPQALPRTPGTDPSSVSHPAPGSSADLGSGDFRFDQACVERLSGILRQYEGTHCFHNYTVKVASTSPEARRFIVRFRCEGTFELEVRLVPSPAAARILTNRTRTCSPSHTGVASLLCPRCGLKTGPSRGG